MTATGVIKLDAVANARDVGLFINNASDKKLLKSGRLFRSARPDFATSSDRDVLESTLKIKTVIDLRSKTEQLQAASTPRSRGMHIPPATADEASAPLLPDPPLPAAPPSPLPPSMRVVKIDFNGPRFVLSLILALPVLDILRLIYFYALGQRVAAIRVLSPVLTERGLSAEGPLLSSWGEVRSIFAVLAEPSNWPVLVHCTQGKDRTGLVVLLLEMLGGVGADAMEADYMASQKGLAAERDERVREIAVIGLPESFADCAKGWVGDTVAFIGERWGNVEGYLRWCGVPDDHVASVRSNLIDPDLG